MGKEGKESAAGSSASGGGGGRREEEEKGNFTEKILTDRPGDRPSEQQALQKKQKCSLQEFEEKL